MTDELLDLYSDVGPCAKCGKRLDGHFQTKPGTVPEEGDVSICWYCQNVMIYTRTGLRPMTDEEKLEVEPIIRGLRARLVRTKRGK